MIEQILKDIFIIKVPLPGNPLKNLNSYFIKGPHKNLLIDTGFNNDICYQALKTCLDDLEADMSNTDIFLTHFHSDHCGLCARIASENTKIYISETDKKYLDLAFSNTYWDNLYARYLKWGFPQFLLQKHLTENPMKAYLPPKETKFIPVKEGTRFNIGNYSLIAIATPGHTPGHMCLYDKEGKILFCGDHIIFDITPNITSWEGVQNSLGLYIESLKKIRKLDIKATLSAHRSSTGNCYDRIEQLINHHKIRLAETYQIVKAFPGSNIYEIASKMKWSIKANNWTDFPINQKWFAVGEASSHLEYLFCKGFVKRELKDGVLIYR